MHALTRHLLALLALAVLFTSAANAACLGDQNTTKVYTFDVVPQHTATKIYTT